MKITVANAPISYGAFELTVGIDPNVPDGEAILNEVRDAGYAGIDLGPVGYLGDGPVLAERLASRQLGLAGAYLEFPFTDHDALPALYPELDAMLDTFDAVRSVVPGPVPHPTIADSGSERRRNNPGRSHGDRSWGLDDDGWDRMKVGLAAVVERCRARGYEPTFHLETGTYVEAPWEVQRVLDISDVGLCLDTGHFFVGGGDPVVAIHEWSDRINHVHVKDALQSVIDGIVADHVPAMNIWTREAFPAFGDGDANVAGVLAALKDVDYEGWLVVEQDIFPQTSERFAQAIDDQKKNRRFLADHQV
ncbi:MAG: TIM barrel protein [Acidimicrobiales bacterium]|jgi:inosose dehydratase